jgi:SAM-dependent methyltransferase
MGITKRVSNLLHRTRKMMRMSGNSQENWDRKWARADFAPPWLNRGVSREIIQAVDDGWFVPGARALDIGCGQGEVALWLARQGFPTLGIDIAPAAIARATKLAGSAVGVSFQVLDICAATPQGPFGALVDRGCLHQIRPQFHALYAANVARACDAGARFLLLARAFRNGIEFGDLAERNRVIGDVSAALESVFSIDRVEATFLDGCDGKDAQRALSGMAFWMTRR